MRLRYNIWTVFIRPLVELGMMLQYAGSISQEGSLMRWARCTFKRLTGLSQGIKNEICNKLMLVDLEEEMKKKFERAENHS